MTIKLIGAGMIIAACGAVGFSMAASHRREEVALRQLIRAMDYMGCELQYRLTPLPELCRNAAAESAGVVSQALLCLAGELENQIAPDASSCMNAALSKTHRLPKRAEENLRLLGSSLGRFDLQGQLSGLEQTRHQCRRELEELTNNRDVRLRSYQTLGLCAGSALAILFL
jgi:stage III sporulation protein AB